MKRFLLSLDELTHTHTPVQIVEVLLRHASRTAPGFEIPLMVPRVLVEASGGEIQAFCIK